MKALRIYVLCVILCFTDMLLAQDVNMSQFYMLPLELNPALTGNGRQDFRISGGYRNQWSSLGNVFRTMSMGYDMPMFEDVEGTRHFGGGISVIQDKAGSTQYGFWQVGGSAAYHLKVDRFSTLSGGIKVAYGRRQVDLSNVKWESQHNGNNHDPSLPSGELAFAENFGFIDAGGGVLYEITDPYADFVFTTGLSVMHTPLTKNSFADRNIETLKPKYNLHASLVLGYPFMSVEPQLLITKHVSSYQATLGSLVMLIVKPEPESRYTDAHTNSKIGLGIFYRTPGTAFATLLYDYRKSVKIGMSYDFLVGTDLSDAANGNGGFELTLIYDGKLTKKKIAVKKEMRKNKEKKPKSKGKKYSPDVRM